MWESHMHSNVHIFTTNELIVWQCTISGPKWSKVYGKLTNGCSWEKQAFMHSSLSSSFTFFLIILDFEHYGSLSGWDKHRETSADFVLYFFFRFWPMNHAKARSTSLVHAGRVLLRAYVVLSRHCSKIPFWRFMPFRLVPVLLSHLKAWIKNILHSQRWLIYVWFICLEEQKVFFGGWLSLWHFTVDRITLGCDYILSTHRRWGRFSAYFIQEECLVHLRLSGPLL